jgi:hypothetical protein
MSRRGSGDLKAQLGSFLRGAWHQLDGVREVVSQRTRQGRAQLDLTLLKRKRKDALAALGELTLRLARSGKLDEADWPELSGPLADVEEVEGRIEREERRARAAAAGVELPDEPTDGDAGDADDGLEGADARPPWARPARWPGRGQRTGDPVDPEDDDLDPPGDDDA